MHYLPCGLLHCSARYLVRLLYLLRSCLPACLLLRLHPLTYIAFAPRFMWNIPVLIVLLCHHTGPSATAWDCLFCRVSNSCVLLEQRHTTACPRLWFLFPIPPPPLPSRRVQGFCFHGSIHVSAYLRQDCCPQSPAAATTTPSVGFRAFLLPYGSAGCNYLYPTVLPLRFCTAFFARLTFPCNCWIRACYLTCTHLPPPFTPLPHFIYSLFQFTFIYYLCLPYLPLFTCHCLPLPCLYISLPLYFYLPPLPAIVTFYFSPICLFVPHATPTIYLPPFTAHRSGGIGTGWLGQARRTS